MLHGCTEAYFLFPFERLSQGMHFYQLCSVIHSLKEHSRACVWGCMCMCVCVGVCALLVGNRREKMSRHRKQNCNLCKVFNKTQGMVLDSFY